MKRILKPILFSTSLFFCFFLSAQPALKEYINTESERIKKMRAEEKDIEQFIEAALPGYKLNQSELDEIIKKGEQRISKSQKEKIIYNIKKDKLRKLYFDNHPEALTYYRAINPPQTLMQTCINGDFEDPVNPAFSYTFNSAGLQTITTCTTPPVTNSSVTPAVNDLNSPVTIVNRGVIPFDPTLNIPGRGILVPTVSAGGGDQSIKLNTGDGGRDVTTMTRTVQINGPTLEYEFSLLLQASDHLPDQLPFFRVNIIGPTGRVTTVRCITPGLNCIFARSHNSDDGIETDKDIFYSGWRCDQIDVSDFIGDNVTIEFTIGDCTLGQHFGTVYIDNVCNYTCTNTTVGFLQVDNLISDCNTVVSSSTYSVCGLVIPPVNATLTGLTIAISQNGGPFETINSPSLTLEGNQFCFIIDPALFGTIVNGSVYQFQVVASFTQTCRTTSVNGSNTAVASVTFNNCPCPPTIALASPLDDVNNTSPLRLQEAANSIFATNKINFGNNNPGVGVVYTAGGFIELNEGFEAKFTSQFAAYIKDCPGTFTYRPQKNDNDRVISNSIKSIQIEKGILIYPNPADNRIDIIMSKSKFKRVIIQTVDGKKIFEQGFASTYKYQADINRFAKGIYIVTVTTDDGQYLSEKLIKN